MPLRTAEFSNKKENRRSMRQTIPMEQNDVGQTQVGQSHVMKTGDPLPRIFIILYSVHFHSWTSFSLVANDSLLYQPSLGSTELLFRAAPLSVTNQQPIHAP